MRVHLLPQIALSGRKKIVNSQLLACWIILHVFLLPADYLQTNVSGIPSECQINVV